MPDKPFMTVMKRGCFWLLTMLLPALAGSVIASGSPLISAPLPPAVAHGQIAPLDRLPGTNQLRLTLCLPLRHPQELTHLLAAIYSPGNPQYHHYLTPGEFAARFGPSPDDYAAVIHFASTNGFRVTGTHPNRLLVDVAGRVADVERALHVRLHSYRHPSEPRNFFAPDTEPTVDARLPLLKISGLDDFYRPHPNVVDSGPVSRRSPQDGTSTNPPGYYLGNDFRQAYVPGTRLTGAGQNVALVEFDNFDPADITNYAEAIGLTNLPLVTVLPVDGGFGPPSLTSGEEEVALDIELVMAMAPGVTNIFVYEAPNSFSSPWADMLGQIADDNLAAQVSCSWSGGGPDAASEQIFLQMAAQGQSFFCAAGDIGAYTNVIPFPSSSPNVTEVGGTTLITDTNQNWVAETVWNRGDGSAGGGGIDLSVELPLWQMGVAMTNGGSPVWRDIPDVALTAEDIYVLVNGQGNRAGGTSCAAPLWAAFTALINQQAELLGAPPVGFLNPALYALCRGTNYPALFHDIVSGSNTNLINPTNYYAGPGYDLCTGWGTPMGTNLIYALATPDPLGILLPTNLISSGIMGGPFTETNWLITLTNAGLTGLDWTLGNVPSWLAVSATGGRLAPGNVTNLAVQWINPDAFSAGGYRTALMFTNLALSRIQNVLVQFNVSQSIVLNGGFETGDFSDWTLVGDTETFHNLYNTVATAADYPGVVHSGNYGAFLGENGFAATLSQTLPTVPGQHYLVSFWLDDLIPGSVQSFNAFWNGTNLTSLLNPPAFTWSNFLTVVTASDTNSLLEFDVENDPSYFGLDDITATPVTTGLPPVATSQTVTLEENGTANLTLTGSDPQDWTLTYTVLTQPTNGTLSGTPPNLTYSPAANFFGSDSFTFQTTDGLNNSALATVSLVVRPVLVFADFSISTNGFQADWASQAGSQYQVQYTTDLTQNAWQTLGTITATTSTSSFMQTNWTGWDPQGFYRLVLLP
jgi:hypothetical protein